MTNSLTGMGIEETCKFRDILRTLDINRFINYYIEKYISDSQTSSDNERLMTYKCCIYFLYKTLAEMPYCSTSYQICMDEEGVYLRDMEDQMDKTKYEMGYAECGELVGYQVDRTLLNKMSVEEIASEVFRTIIGVAEEEMKLEAWKNDESIALILGYILFGGANHGPATLKKLVKSSGKYDGNIDRLDLDEFAKWYSQVIETLYGK